MYFFLRADYYLKPRQKRWINVWWSWCKENYCDLRLLLESNNVQFLLVLRHSAHAVSIYACEEKSGIPLSPTHISRDIHGRKLWVMNLRYLQVVGSCLRLFFHFVHKGITLVWILWKSVLGCKVIVLQNIYILSHLIQLFSLKNYHC